MEQRTTVRNIAVEEQCYVVYLFILLASGFQKSAGFTNHHTLPPQRHIPDIKSCPGFLTLRGLKTRHADYGAGWICRPINSRRFIMRSR